MIDRTRRTILVVEDDVAVRQLIVHTLRRIGFVVLEAGGAVDGLSIFRAHRDIDLIIIDMILPGMSGLDLAAELDRQRPGLKILYTSGSIESIAMQCIADRRPDCVLSKPFSGATLLAKVDHLVSG